MNGVIANMKFIYLALILSACGSPDQMPSNDVTSTGGSSALEISQYSTGGSSSTGGQGNTTTTILQDASTSPDQAACEASLSDGNPIARCASKSTNYGDTLCAIACNIKACYGLLYNYNQNQIDNTASAYISGAKIYGVTC